jgi:hypothetical protein
MPKQTILDNEYFSLWYDPDLGAVHHRIKKPLPVEPMKTLLDKGREVLEEKGLRKWLSDDRNNSVVPKEVEEWSETNWLPQMAAAGWKYWAVVMPATAVAKLNIAKFEKPFTDLGVTVQYFTDLKVAQKWLSGL